MNLSSKFHRVLWYYTQGHENLFQLSEEDLYTYMLIVEEATRYVR